MMKKKVVDLVVNSSFSSKLLIALLLSVFLISSSCTISQGGPDDEVYTGTHGVEMYFMPNSPPQKFYFYPDSPPEENQFSVSIGLENNGASYSRGGIFISGYDPNLIDIQGIEEGSITSIWDCPMSFSWFGDQGGGNPFGGDFGAAIECEDWGGSYSGPENWLLDFDELQLFGTSIGLEVGNSGGEPYVYFDMDADNIDLAYGSRGIRFATQAAFLGAFDFINTHGKEFTLMGDSYMYPGGEQDFIDFTAEVIEDHWPDGLDKTTQTFLATTCYSYVTYASPMVCIDPVPYSDNKKVCAPRTQTFSGGQGSPIAITKIEQENTPKKIFFTIYVENKGKGMVYDSGPGHLQKCDPWTSGRVTQKDVDLLFLGDIRMAGDLMQLDCIPDNRQVRLQNGKGQIRCEYDLEYANAKSAYQAPLVIEFWYAYSETMMTETLIKRAA